MTARISAAPLRRSGGRGGARSWGAWSSALATLCPAVIVVLVLFRHDAIKMATIWWTSSTFEHCLFVLPIIVWLMWQRADLLGRLVPRGWAPGLLLVAAGAGGWLLGQAAGVAVARHLGLVMMVQGCVVATLGPAVTRGLAFPLGYAVFLVPAGEGLVPPLQALTARMCMGLLALAGVPARLDGVFITTASGWFEVAEACSGAKFLIAMLALGALVANLCFRSVPRRAMFMAAAIVVPVIANGVRAFGTIYVAHLTDVHRAGGFDHVVYGWFFFGAVIAILLGASWRYFDRHYDDPAFDAAAIEPVAPADDPRRRLTMAIAAAAIAAAPALWASAVSGAPLPPAPMWLPPPPGWTRAMPVGDDWRPSFPGADRMLRAAYIDTRGDVVDLAVAAYGNQAEGREIVGFGIGAVGEHSRWAWASDGPAIADGRAMRIVGPDQAARDVALFYRVGDTLTGSETRVKLETLRARLTGRNQRAVAVVLSAPASRGNDGWAAIARFRAAIGPIAAIADRAAR